MDITIWNILAYISKWRKWIFIGIAVALLSAFAYANINRNYYSEIIIEYTNQSAVNGKAADGTKLNVYEIISPNIIEKALIDVGSGLSTENVRSSMSITPIIPQKVLDLQKSKLLIGEEYTYFPTKYLIKYVDYYGNSKNFTQDLLDAIIKNYMIHYSEKYVNKESLTQINKDLNSETNDYLEMAEIISTNTDKVIEILQHRSQASADYRSPSTGMSFLDLLYQYQELSKIDIPRVFAYIFGNQVTRNKEVLIKKYTYKREQYYIAQKNKLSQAELTLGLMNEFAKANIDVANSYNVAENSTDSQYTTDLEISEKLSKDKTTYDTMALDYINYGIDANTNLYSAQYADTVIKIFEDNKSGTEDVGYIEGIKDAENAESAEDTEDTKGVEDAKGAEDAKSVEDTEGTEDVEYVEYAESAEYAGGTEDVADAKNARDAKEAEIITAEKIDAVNQKWTELFTITDKTMRDYNSYVSSQHISFITGVVVSETVNSKLYLMIAFVLGLGCSLVFAIGYETIKHKWALNYKKVS
ncbi:MAG TPA: hypothetical protein GXX75_19385 [Clostridiales bacterium]|nr:hypothetical protein [Clostridiales bacterium]